MTEKMQGLRLLLMTFALAIAMAVGVLIRLVDPLSSPVIVAEDPYTHMMHVREHLRDGYLQPFNEGATLYPPGLHALLAAAWVYTGAELYDIFRIGPVLMGALGVLGAGLLLYRTSGAVAGFVGATAMAVLPEVVFRTTMMSPTALDLALVPFFILAVVEVMHGRLAWAGVVGVMSGYFVLTHPWLLAILLPVVLVAVALCLLFPWRGAPANQAVGCATLLLILAGSAGLAVSFCAADCGLSFDRLNVQGAATGLDLVQGTVALAAVVAAAVLLMGRRTVARMQKRLQTGRTALVLGVAASLFIVAAVVAVTLPALHAGMPEHVNLPRMVGWPLLALAGLGLVALPFMRGPVAHFGAAIVTVTYPFVVHNPFQSEFWPHRTVAYMAIGVVILAAVAAAAAVRLAARGAAWGMKRIASRRRLGSSGPVMAGIMVPVVFAAAFGGTVFAATPHQYENGWYRLYHDCEFEGIRGITEGTDPSTVIITGDWRPRLVAGAFHERPSNVWYSLTFLHNAEERERDLAHWESTGQEAIVLVDRHTLNENRDLDLSFLEEAPWTHVGSWCDGGFGQPRLMAYTTGGRP